MEFDTLNALRDLDRGTPDYIRGELFAHGDLTVRKNAIEVLTTLDPVRRSARILMLMLSIAPSGD